MELRIWGYPRVQLYDWQSENFKLTVGGRNLWNLLTRLRRSLIGNSNVRVARNSEVAASKEIR
jgi:hypothetical protein